MIDYKKFRYIYPPRAEDKIQPKGIDKYDNGDYIAQVKYNGSNTTIFLDGKSEPKIYNREGKEVSKSKLVAGIDYKGIHSGKGWMVVCGELMNKAKKGEDGRVLKGFIIWDILVHEGQYLIGKTMEERLFLLEKLFPTERMMVTPNGMVEYKHLSFTNVEGVYKTVSYVHNFRMLYDGIIQVDAYEGMVIKKAVAKLDFGFNETNNFQWQLKIRKPTKNYSH